MRGTHGSLPSLIALVVAVSACGDAGERQSAAREAAAPAGEETRAAAARPAPAYEVVATGLMVPWDLGFADDGRVFVTERPGRIRVIQNGSLRPEPWAELDVAAVGEAGLTSIALAPDFARSGAVYVLGTFRSGGELVNRVVRLTDRDGRGTDPRVVVDGMAADRIHAGSALEFGPDGLLYVTVGDAAQPELAQRPGVLAGKLLRYTPEGKPAPGNPGGGPVYALGLRNVQGLDWHPSGEIFASEHGPSGLGAEGGRTGDDELNRIVAGDNYGWPEVAGRGGGDRFVEPLAVWDPAIAPSGLAIYTGDGFPEWRGHAFLGALRGRHLRRVALQEAGGWSAGEQEALFERELGRIRAVRMGPDGHLYFTTSNRDGRGNATGEDDRILRLVPR